MPLSKTKASGSASGKTGGNAGGKAAGAKAGGGGSKKRPMALDVTKLKKVSAKKKKPRRKEREAAVEMVGCVHQKGPLQGTPTGRAYLKLTFDPKLNESFKAARDRCSFLGEVRFYSKDDASWHVKVTAPEMWTRWLQLVPEDNAFKRAFAGKTVAPCAEYAPPQIKIVRVTDTGRVFLDVEPLNGLFYHNDTLTGDGGLFSYETGIAGVEGLDRIMSVEAMDVNTAMQQVHDGGFDSADVAVCETTTAELEAIAFEPESAERDDGDDDEKDDEDDGEE